MYRYNSKGVPQYSLDDVKRLIRQGNVISTASATRGAHALGLSVSEMYDVILELQRKDFSVSRVDERNHKLWQDAYKKHIDNVEVYIKFQIKEIQGKKLLLLSFKENEVF